MYFQKDMIVFIIIADVICAPCVLNASDVMCAIRALCVAYALF